ncbi:MAG: DUF4173 domain-containing protein [Anaerolineales bacterium]
MKANPNRFWFIVLLLGWVFDFLFWEKPFGVNFAIYITLCLATGIFLLRADGLRLTPRSSLLLFPIAFLTALTFFRLEPMTVFLSVALTIFLMGVFAMTYLGGRWTHYALLDYVFGYFRLIGSMLVRPLGFAAEIKRDQPVGSPKRNSTFWSILRGLLIALPIVAIFASILASADVVFAKRLDDFIALFKIDNLPQYIFRLVYILIFAYAIAGIYLHAANSADEKISEDKPVVPAFLGFTESAIVLGSVAILFAAFVAVQFEYFFGGQANISFTGYTFSEYARRGFGELVAVAFFSLLMLLGLGAITRRETETQRRVFSGLGVALVGLVLVMLVSAFQRLVLYETAYGFSRLRTYTHVFMIWLALLLVVVVVLEILRRDRAVAFAMLVAFFGFIVSLGILNVDKFIVQHNIQRELDVQTKPSSYGRVELDTQYFVDLSDDAVPPLVNAFLDKSLPNTVHEKIGAALVCKKYNRDLDESLPWQGFHFSRFSADRMYETVKSGLAEYEHIAKDYPFKVKAPSGEEYYCSQYYGD